MYLPRQRADGFTLIELLVVIAIISLLSSVVLANIGAARERAQAVRMAQDLQQMEHAFYLLALHENIDEWWHECEFGFGSGNCNPRISDLVTDTNRLGMYLTQAPVAPFGNGTYRFDNDGDTYTCGTSANRGVNIYVTGATTAEGRRLSQVIDGNDDLTCGRVNMAGTNLHYKLGYSSTDY